MRTVIAMGLVLGAMGCTTLPLTSEGRAGCATTVTGVSSGNARMLPGAACLTCHHFTAAGTVFPSATASCELGGVPGVRVEILDSTGHAAITMVTNEAGNFYTYDPLPSPFTARVTAPDGTVQSMRTPQTNGSCAHCHRVPPVEAAPGRIAIPMSQDGSVGDAGVGDGG
jgi:hypothetical protein